MDIEPTLRSERFPESNLPITIARLLDDAAASLDQDLAAAKSYIARASALLQARRSLDRTSRTAPSAPGVARGGLAQWQVRRVAAHIDAELGKPVRAGELAGIVRLSVSHFSRAFKVSFGRSPQVYVALRRMELAKVMMATTDEPLSQIAVACGLCDQPHFCRVFRRFAGVTPNEWRREHCARRDQPME